MRILNTNYSGTWDKQTLKLFKDLFNSVEESEIEILSYDRRSKTLFIRICGDTYGITRKDLSKMNGKIRKRKESNYFFFEVTYTQFSLGGRVIKIHDDGSLHKKFHG